MTNKEKLQRDITDWQKSAVMWKDNSFTLTKMCLELCERVEQLETIQSDMTQELQNKLPVHVYNRQQMIDGGTKWAQVADEDLRNAIATPAPTLFVNGQPITETDKQQIKELGKVFDKQRVSINEEMQLKNTPPNPFMTLDVQSKEDNDGFYYGMQNAIDLLEEAPRKCNDQFIEGFEYAVSVLRDAMKGDK